MPVVINDFEVVNDAPTETREASAKSSSEGKKPAEAPEDLELAARWLNERHERLRAH